MKHLLLASAALGGALFVTPALAEERATDDARGVTVEDVVVTARRVSENIQSVPQSITAFSDDAIRAQNIVMAGDLMSRVPSLQITQSSTTRESVIFNIRAQGQAFLGAEPAVIPYFAEVPSAVAGVGTLFDLANLQILKGPQGTLFGRNTTGGAILIEPRRPSFEFGGFGEVSAGSYELRRFQGAINVPIIEDRLAVRLAADINSRRGFTTEVSSGRDYDDRNYSSFRIGVLANLTDGLSNYLVGTYSHSDTNGGGLVLTSVRPGLTTVSRLFPNIGQIAAAGMAGGVRVVNYSMNNGYDRIWARGLTNVTTLEVSPNLTIKNIAGYRDYKEEYAREGDGGPIAAVEYPPLPGFRAAGNSTIPSHRQYSEELQFQVKAFEDTLNLIAGVYYEKRVPAFGPQMDRQIQFGNLVYTVTRRREESQAIFAEGTWDASQLVEGLELFAGARYTKDSRELISNPNRTVPPTPQTLRFQSATFKEPTWRVGANLQIAPRTMAYVSARRGYKSGGFNASSIAFPTFQPEYLTDVEVGLKSDFDVGAARARIAADVYAGKFKDIQISKLQVLPNNTFENVISNAASANIKGAEVEGTVVMPFGLTVSGFYNYTRAKYGNYISGTDNFTGLQFHLVPKHKASITATYDIPLSGDGEELSLSATHTWQSTVRLTLQALADPVNSQPRYGLTNLRAEWRNVLGHPVDVSAFVTNLTNKTYQIYRISTYTSSGYGAGLYGEPRMYGVSLRHEF